MASTQAKEGNLAKAGSGTATVPVWIPTVFVGGAVAIVAVSVTISIIRDRQTSNPQIQPAAVAQLLPPDTQRRPEVEEDLPPLPPAGDIRGAAAHTRIQQLIAQLSEAIATRSETRARALAELLAREGDAAAPFIDRAIAQSMSTRVRSELSRVRSRLLEPIVSSEPVYGPPPP